MGCLGFLELFWLFEAGLVCQKRHSPFLMLYMGTYMTFQDSFISSYLTQTDRLLRCCVPGALKREKFEFRVRETKPLIREQKLLQNEDRDLLSALNTHRFQASSERTSVTRGWRWDACAGKTRCQDCCPRRGASASRRNTHRWERHGEQ